MYLFCDKTFVIRPTSNPKKLKLTKIGQKLEENRQYTPLGPFWGVQPNFFYNMLHCYNMNISSDKSFALKSKTSKFLGCFWPSRIKNCPNWALLTHFSGGIRGFSLTGTPWPRKSWGIRSMGGGALPSNVFA